MPSVTLTSTHAESTATEVLSVPMHTAEVDAIRASFCEHGANLLEIKEHLHSIVLPKIRRALGWTGVRATKGRVNDWRTVELKYNSLFHRDRHIFGAAAAEVCHSAVKQNMSAVVYLDPAQFDYISGSQAPGAHATAPQKLQVAEGTILLFPSCLIHRAVALAESKQRRTIVLFDLEDPSESAPLRHDIVICPWWTQKPLLHSVKSEEEVEQQMLQDLLASRPYFWRYYKQRSLCRTHWQITTVHDDVPTIGADRQTVPYNTSFYLIAPQEYPPHVHVHDHRSSMRYIFNLLRFHLGCDVLA